MVEIQLMQYYLWHVSSEELYLPYTNCKHAMNKAYASHKVASLGPNGNYVAHLNFIIP